MAWCRRRQAQEDEPESWKRRKVSLGEQRDPPRHAALDDIVYPELVSAAEELSPSLLAAKVGLLRSVLSRAQRCAESLEELPQPPPADAPLSYVLSKVERRELKQALRSPPHCQFGVSRIATKEARSLEPGKWTTDEVINEYAKLLTRDSDLPVTSSYVFELLRDMRRANKFDVAKIEQALEKSGLSSECPRLALPICWGDHDWSCALICQPSELITHYATQGRGDHQDIFELLQWFVQNLYLGESPFAESRRALPQSPTEDSGPVMLYVLRCLATGRTPEWSACDLQSMRRLLALEIKRASLLSAN